MSDSPPKPGEDVVQLSSEITAYLKGREGAADTFDGLVTWWLYRQRFADTQKKIQLAIDYLCHKGVIDKRILADGSVLYIATGRNLDE